MSECSLAFGNGFSTKLDFCDQRTRMQHSAVVTTVRAPAEPIDAGTTAACFVNDAAHTTFCSIADLVMDPRRISVSKGGEEIEGE